MDVESTVELSEPLANLVENVACHVAQDYRGRITPAHLMPYLPLSLRVIEAGLDGMVNEQSVFSERRDGLTEYVFAAYQDRPERRGPTVFAACASCGVDLENPHGILCVACAPRIRAELAALAEKNAWPAHAVYEHEMLYLAAREGGTTVAETLAAGTRYTLRNTRTKLKRLVVEGFARQVIDEAAGVERFSFGEIVYPTALYRANMDVVRSFPASVMEEVELKVVRIIVTLALMILGMFVLALMRVPFRPLVGAFVVAAPVTALVLWRRRRTPTIE